LRLEAAKRPKHAKQRANNRRYPAFGTIAQSANNYPGLRQHDVNQRSYTRENSGLGIPLYADRDRFDTFWQRHRSRDRCGNGTGHTSCNAAGLSTAAATARSCAI
jgi:hypothetical protein